VSWLRKALDDGSTTTEDVEELLAVANKALTDIQVKRQQDMDLEAELLSRVASLEIRMNALAS
jgi:hypothetical protein